MTNGIGGADASQPGDSGIGGIEAHTPGSAHWGNALWRAHDSEGRAYDSCRKAPDREREIGGCAARARGSHSRVARANATTNLFRAAGENNGVRTKGQRRTDETFCSTGLEATGCQAVAGYPCTCERLPIGAERSRGSHRDG